MHRVSQDQLPFVGSSHQFVGAEQGDVGISVFLLSAPPGREVPRHRHPYDEVQFVREGRGVWTVDGEELEAARGTSWSSRPARCTASAASATGRWCRWTCI